MSSVPIVYIQVDCYANSTKPVVVLEHMSDVEVVDELERFGKVHQ